MGNYNFFLDLESVNSMSVIEGWIERDATVMEFGPANGRLTRYLKEQKNCYVTIVEIDDNAGRQAANYAQESYIGSAEGDIEAYVWLNTQKQYDYIVFADVLEHLRNPVQVLEACKKILKKSGQILVSVPNVAHNSVLLELLQDRFFYDEVGLLDKTHIHFFTYKSFVQMLNQCGMQMEEIVPIYSCVGSNEIPNQYTDVPVTVERYLRKRESGSVYQYVSRLSICEEPYNKGEFNMPFEPEQMRVLDVQCYFNCTGDDGFDDKYRCSTLVSSEKSVAVEFSLPAGMSVRQIRLDPMRLACIVLLRDAYVENADGTNVAMEVSGGNMVYDAHPLYVFASDMPCIIFEQLQSEYTPVKVRFSFEILSFGESAEYYRNIAEHIHEVFGDAGNPSANYKIMQAHRDFEDRLQQGLRDAEQYVMHLERDIETLTRTIVQQRSAYEERIESLESALCDAKSYVEHLEKDILELKETINPKRT